MNGTDESGLVSFDFRPWGLNMPWPKRNCSTKLAGCFRRVHFQGSWVLSFAEAFAPFHGPVFFYIVISRFLSSGIFGRYFRVRKVGKREEEGKSRGLEMGKGTRLLFRRYFPGTKQSGKWGCFYRFAHSPALLPNITRRGTWKHTHHVSNWVFPHTRKMESLPGLPLSYTLLQFLVF